MPLSRIFDITASALAAQAQRLNVVASNLANADSVATPEAGPYRSRQVVFSTVPFGAEGAIGVRTSAVVMDDSPPRRLYEPSHPLADAQGYVTLSNVSVVDEMVNMISASRAYQNQVEVMNTARQLMLKTLTLGQ